MRYTFLRNLGVTLYQASTRRNAKKQGSSFPLEDASLTKSKVTWLLSRDLKHFEITINFLSSDLSNVE